MKPFLKWAGNKYSIIQRIKTVLPEGNRLIEPFAGAAAVFLNTDFNGALLSDINGDLISLYQYLKEEGEAFITYCESLFAPAFNQQETYYTLRQLFNRTGDKRLKAALFLYLNRHGYNGLCRYNSKGEYNVPFGRYSKPYFPREEMLSFRDKIQFAELRHEDFLTAMERARAGDVVYCDPPYVPLTETSNFTAYTRGGFGPREQQALADKALALSKRGVHVVISNHDTVFTQTAYQGAQIISFNVQRFISCKGNSRGQAKEMLALFGVHSQQKKKQKSALAG